MVRLFLWGATGAHGLKPLCSKYTWRASITPASAAVIKTLRDR